MKLFTEEEVKKAIRIARSSQNTWATPLTYDEHEVLGKLKFIELEKSQTSKIRNQDNRLSHWFLSISIFKAVNQ